MKSSFTLIFYLLMTLAVLAQTPERYIVKAGETAADALPAGAVYAFPAFTKGVVFLRNSSSSVELLNYNCVLDEMQFLGSKGDTLTIAEPSLVSRIQIDTAVFYYDKVYLREVSQTDSCKLAARQMLVQSPDKTLGGYDMPTASSSITTYGSLISNSANYKLQVKKDVFFERKMQYYIGDQFNHFMKADKKGFYTLFSKKRDLIQKFAADNNINYRIKEDVEKLWQFCIQ